MRLIITMLCSITIAGAQVSPSGGQTDSPWRPGTAVDISWDNTLEAPSVDIDLYDAARRRRIALARGIDGRQRTTGVVLPDSLPHGDHYLVFITDATTPSTYVRSSGYVPISPSLTRVRPTDVPETRPDREAYSLAPNPTTASAVLTWDVLGVRRIRVIGADGVARLERDVEPMDRRLVMPSDRWASGTYIVELVGATSVIGRLLMAVVR
jgi:hypothetical protein